MVCQEALYPQERRDPDDRERMKALAQASIDRAGEWEVKYRLLCPGRNRELAVLKGTVLLSDDGRPARRGWGQPRYH